MEKEIKCPKCGSKKIRKYNEDCISHDGGEVKSDDCTIRYCLEEKCHYKWKESNLDKGRIPTTTEKKCPDVIVRK